jgi:predicted AAA+ superfamily ATPase
MPYLKRNIDNLLAEWKKRDITYRWPLLIRGARQVGKSYTVTEFGEKEFENLVKINFEQPGMILENTPVKLNTNISRRYFIQSPKW